MSFILTLIGNSIEYYRDFVRVFKEMARRGLGKGKGQCILDEVYTPTEQGGLPIYLNKTGQILRAPVIRSWSELLAQPEIITEKVRVRFLTPTRIKNEGRLIDEPPPFDVLMSRLLQRISDLDREYCNDSLRLSEEVSDELVKHARERVDIINYSVDWHDWGRYSSSRDQKNPRMKLGGIIGEVVYYGQLTQFIPFLLLAEHVHVGKQSTFGNGAIKVDIF